MPRTLSHSEVEALYAKAAEVYRPAAPVDQRSFFAGRLQQINDLLDALRMLGQHAVLYGERGVGKTSLANILPALQPGTPVVRHNCQKKDTFARLWRRALDAVKFSVEKPGVGFNSTTKKEVVSLATSVSKEPASDEVIDALRRVSVPVVFVFDEFDVLEDKTIGDTFAEVMKALSDYAVPAKIVIVGIGDNVDTLIAAHASVERAMRQVYMPRMAQNEAEEIIDTANAELGMECDPATKTRIVRLAQGLPHYVHLLGLQSTRRAIVSKTTAITMDALDAGIIDAVEYKRQSLLDIYMKAISTPQKQSLYKHVLLACALTKTDDQSSFQPAAVRVPLEKIGRKLDIPAFASHLNKFATEDRGNVLKKFGKNRRFRYRFSNPMLQPYVVMKGIAEGVVTAAAVDEMLEAAVMKQGALV